MINNSDNFVIENRKLIKAKQVSGSVVIPSNVDVIDRYAFETLIGRFGEPCNFFELKEVEMLDGVKIIGDSAFRANVGLEKVKFPSTLEEIHGYAFYYCGVKEYELPNSLKYIGFGAFSLNENLERLVIPESVQHIRGYIISFCSNLKELVIHDNISTISKNAFFIRNITGDDYYRKIPDCIVINYTSYEKLNALLKKLISRGCFDKVSKYRLRLVGSTLNKIEEMEIYNKLLNMNCSDLEFICNDDMSNSFVEEELVHGSNKVKMLSKNR